MVHNLKVLSADISESKMIQTKFNNVNERQINKNAIRSSIFGDFFTVVILDCVCAIRTSPYNPTKKKKRIISHMVKLRYVIF